VGKVFDIVLGILSRPGALPLARYFLLRSYTSLVKYVCSGICGRPCFSNMKLSMSCHRNCRTAHVYLISCFVWWWQSVVAGCELIVCCACISCAMLLGCISMLLFLSFILFGVGFDVFLNILLCHFLRDFSRLFCICFIVFCIFLLVCFCIMALASYLAFFPCVTSSFIHSSIGIWGGGGCGTLLFRSEFIAWFP
jgi:hypothetical protein